MVDNPWCDERVGEGRATALLQANQITLQPLPNPAEEMVVVRRALATHRLRIVDVDSPAIP